jgi:opacity protein-like surface antigen
MEKRGFIMKPTALKSIVLQSMIIATTLCLLGPDACAQGPGMPTYDGEFASGNADYSRTYEPNPDGGYTENTYVKDPKGINHLVEIRKFPKGAKKKDTETYHWCSNPYGPNGSTINLTMSVYGGVPHYTKEIIGGDGSKTNYVWDDKEHWVKTAYTPAPSKTPTVEQTPKTTETSQNPPSQTTNGGSLIWIDVGNGHHVLTGPPGWDPITSGNEFHSSVTGRNYAKLSDGTWIDVGNGHHVLTGPPGWDPITSGNEFHSSVTGRNYALVPAPPPPSAQQQPTPTQTVQNTTTPVLTVPGGGPISSRPRREGLYDTEAWSGPYLGGEMVKSWGHVVTTEKVAATGAISNQFNDNHDPFGGGINGGYDWVPWNNKVLVGVGFDLDFPNEEVQHTFASGSYINSTVDVAALVRGRAGYLVMPNLLLYCLAGVSVADQHLQMNLGGATTDEHQPTPGFTAGAGVEWMITTASTGGPRGFLRAPSVFIEYTHTWWSDAELNQPAASPAFNYSWTRESDMVSAGFRVRF